MPVSHFIFQRGADLYEVFVAHKWSEEKLLQVKPKFLNAQPLFLEEDDFDIGSNVFALDFFLMKKTGEHLEGRNLIEHLIVNDKDLRICLEGEVRRLAAKVRVAYFQKAQLPGYSVFNTLQGIADGLIHLGLQDPIPKEVEKLLTHDLSAAIFSRKRTGVLLNLFQEWEEFLHER